MICERESEKTEARPGDFVRCLVGGNAEDQARQRKTRRRALLVSLAVESGALGALLILPLFGKPAEPVVSRRIPVPPYLTHRPVQGAAEPLPARKRTEPCLFCPHLSLAGIPRRNDPPGEPAALDVLPGSATGPSADGPPLGAISGPPREPARPAEPRRQTRIREARIDPALLVHRVEPVFPPLARQIRRSGKVELHAIISADGRVFSLEVVGGDPLFVASALDAVRQWRYKPTYLDGEPVEIDTFITVIYTLEPQ